MDRCVALVKAFDQIFVWVSGASGWRSSCEMLNEAAVDLHISSIIDTLGLCAALWFTFFQK